MRRALIVDDSKTAQIRLKKMLGRYDLEVDTALSGEDALAYLSYRTPAVIFMDHSMEGMDGFEALKIIKANPTTASIPIIMYTAQKGDAYAGQARALGAEDILSKEVIKPSSVERVLRSLEIRPMNTPSKTINTDEGKTAQTTEKKEATRKVNSEDTHLNQVRAQIARLFEIHISDVRTHIAENTKFIVRRLSNDIEKRAVVEQENTTDDIPAPIVEREVAAERTRLGLVSNSLLLLILLGLASIGWLLFDTRMLVDQQHASPPEPPANNASELNAIVSRNIAQENTLATLQQNNQRLLNTISWALENDMRFDYNEAPLNDEFVNKLYGLVFMLDGADFFGSVLIEIHHGNFCLIADTTGNWILPNADMPATNCTLVNSLPTPLNEDYLSLDYLNFEQSAAPIVSGTIQIEMDVLGTTQPRYPYPALIPQTSAGEWNSAAARNNRVSITFPP